MGAGGPSGVWQHTHRGVLTPCRSFGFSRMVIRVRRRESIVFDAWGKGSVGPALFWAWGRCGRGAWMTFCDLCGRGRRSEGGENVTTQGRRKSIWRYWTDVIRIILRRIGQDSEKGVLRRYEPIQEQSGC